MKLIVQIPCLNEESTIAEVVASIPRHIDGIDSVEIIVIDDGSTDGTIAAAQAAGVDEIIRLPRHMGLASAFSTGVTAALRRNADILVNTDADCQYPSGFIPALIAPIKNQTADIVIGDRLSWSPAPFKPFKLALERFGSFCVRMFAGIPVRDAACGFRAFSREALESMVIHGSYSYTLESLILAGIRRLRLVNIPIPISPPRRTSRLFTTLTGYIRRSMIAIIRSYLMYHPLKFFIGIGSVFCCAAAVWGLRFLYLYLHGQGEGHIQSLILLSIFAFLGFQSLVLGFLGDIIANNRRLIEDLRLRHLRDSLSNKG